MLCSLGRTRIADFTPPPASPIHWWKFDDDLTDSVGSLDLTLQIGSPGYVAGVDGNAQRMVQYSSYWDQSGSTTTAILDGGGSFSATCWMRTSNVNVNCSVVNPTGGAQGPWKILHSNSLNWDASEVWNTAQTIRYRATFSPKFATNNVWVFLAMTWDNDTPEHWFYRGVNGAAIESVEGTPNSSWDSRWLGTTNQRIGYGVGGNTDFDDFRIYDVALSSDEIGAIYDEFKP